MIILRKVHMSGASTTSWALDLAKIGTWEFDSDSQTVSWSEQTYDIHEVTVGTPIDLAKAIDFYVEKDRGKISEAVSTCLELGKSYDLNLSIQTPKGRKQVRTTGRRSEGNSKKLEGTFQDISELSDLVALAMYSERRYQEYANILDKTTIIGQTDVRGVITYVNENFCKISGYKESELIGQDHRILNSGFHPKNFFVDLWKTIASGREWRGQVKNRAKDGRYYWVDTYIKPLYDASGKISSYISIRRDISKEKQQQEVDMKTIKLMTIGETASQIMHDVMNPLALIQGCQFSLEHLDPKADMQGQLKEIGGKISQNVDRIKEIFHDMRAMLHGDVDMTPVNLSMVVNESLHALANFVQRSNVKVFNKVEEPHFVVGNKNLLVQLFSNLIKNAVEAVATDNSPWVNIESVDIGRQTVIRIVDSGKGIPLNVQKHMFDSLFTTKKEQGGSGIGLGLCKKLADLHGAEIAVNNKNKNTEIDVIFKHAAG